MYKECFPKQGWAVLDRVSGLMEREKAVLAGGTALALQVGHRISVDLDFFTRKNFRVEKVLSEIGKSREVFRLMDEGEDHFVATLDGVKVSLFRYEYPFLIPPIDIGGVSMAHEMDIAAMKIIAISQRGARRDFVDMFFVLQRIPFHKIAHHLVARYGVGRINPVLIGKGMAFFGDADAQPDPQYRGEPVPWKKIKAFFRGHVKQFVLDLDNAVKQR